MTTLNQDWTLLLLALLLPLGASSSSAELTVNSWSTDTNGVTTYNVTSVYQGSDPTDVRVLEPDSPAPGKPHRFLHILPVEAEGGFTFGDGFELARLLGVHNTYNMTLVAPSFNVAPWFGDHVSDPDIRQESFMTQDILPWLNDTDSNKAQEFQEGSHVLLGFSKSGNGALTLILRGVEKFAATAAWDAPLSVTSPVAGGGTVYGPDAHFDANYNIPNLLATHAASFQTTKRLWLGGGNGNYWQTKMLAIRTLLDGHNLSYEFDNSTAFGHAWNSGWITPAVAFLDAASSTPAAQFDTLIYGN